MKFSEERLIQRYKFSSQAPILVDVGAHQGSFSYPFSARGWQVIAFEPETENRAAFEHRMAQFDNVTCIPKAVSDVTGAHVPFYTSKEHFGIHTLKPFHETHRFAYQVETTRLDDCLCELAVPHVTLLKIDIEGADFLALRSFDFEYYSPELIMVEFMDNRSFPNFGYTHHDMVQFLQTKGYAAFISEWEPIKEYGRQGGMTAPHAWIQCVPYPLTHDPAWGNLIFVPEANRNQFSQTLTLYLKQVQRLQRLDWLKQKVKKIPGAQYLYSRLINH